MKLNVKSSAIDKNEVIFATTGGKDFDAPTVTIPAPAAQTFDGSSSCIVSTSNNNITLSATQIASWTANDKITYTTTGTAIAALTSGTTYYVKTISGNALSLSATSGGSEISITGLGVGVTHRFTGETATATLATVDGVVESVTVEQTGFGYSSAPSITINGTGSSIVNPVISITLSSSLFIGAFIISFIESILFTFEPSVSTNIHANCNI